jgi:hypothetical protein
MIVFHCQIVSGLMPNPGNTSDNFFSCATASGKLLVWARQQADARASKGFHRLDWQGALIFTTAIPPFAIPQRSGSAFVSDEDTVPCKPVSK